MLMFKIARKNKHGGQLGAREGGASASVGEGGRVGLVVKIVMQLPAAMDRHNMGRRLW